MQCVRNWQILLQKSQKARRLISRQRTKQATIADGASNALPESSVSLALGDVVPHIIIQSLHLRVREFESNLAKGLLQQYRHETDMAVQSPHVRCHRGRSMICLRSTGSGSR
jgi:hypothetical protein